MSNKKIIYIVVGLVFVVGVILTFAFGGSFSSAPQKTIDIPERNDTAPQIPFLYDYKTKVVYTTDTTVKKDAYVNDCEIRGGFFNVCGNTCEPTAKNCAKVCALTCEVK